MLTKDVNVVYFDFPTAESPSKMIFRSALDFTTDGASEPVVDAIIVKDPKQIRSLRWQQNEPKNVKAVGAGAENTWIKVTKRCNQLTLTHRSLVMI